MKVIYFKIDKLLNKYKLSQRRVALDCNMRPATMKMYVNNTIQRIGIYDLQSLYNFFHELDDRITLLDLIDIKEDKGLIDLSELDIF